MHFYTYIYFDPRANEPFYVGNGKDDRFKINRHSNKQFLGRINKLKVQNIKPIIEILNTKDEFSAFWLERCFIAAYGRKDQAKGPLFNHTDGGDGVSGLVPYNKGIPHKPETLKLISERLRGVNSPNYGKFGEESNAWGLKHSEEFKQRRKKEMINWWKSRPCITCPNCEKIGKESGAMRRWHFDNCRSGAKS
jgi:hypothetical protein